jgi:Polyketide cyclase / dehydrase and lipid transport
MWTTEASTISSAKPETIWSLYSAVETWPQWDHSLESSQLHGSFRVGSYGEMTIKGAPAPLRFKLTEVKALVVFADETALPGATVHFVHTLEPTPEGTRITHRASITGEHWERFAQTVGTNIEHGLPATVQTLARLAEAQ